MTNFRQKRAYLHQPLAYSVPQSFAPSTFVLCLLATTILHFWLAATIAPTEDELYYWNWAQHLSLSYFDHPPMVAYWIKVSTTIFGNSVVALRLPSIVTSMLVVLILAALSRSANLLSLVLFTPALMLGGILITPDVPLLFFWTTYLFWLTRVNTTLANWDKDPVTRVYRQQPVGWTMWAVGGVLLGLGGLSKYPMALAVPCTFVVLASQTRVRGWISGFAFHLLVALAVVMPVIFFNYRTGFEPFRFQLEHIASTPRPFFAGLFEFIGVQALLVGLLPVLVLPWALLCWGRLKLDPTTHACTIFFALPFTFFLWRGSQTRLEANWPLVAYIGLWPVAQFLIQQSSFVLWRRLVWIGSYAVPLTLTALVLVHAVHPLAVLPPEKDRIRLFDERFRTAQLVAEDVSKLAPAITIYSPNYQWTSQFRYQSLPAEQLAPGSRTSEFTRNAVPACSQTQVLAWERVGHPGEGLGCFTASQLLGSYSVIVRGKTLESYTLKRYTR